MNEEQMISNIKLEAEKIKSFDRKRIYPDGPQAVSWNNFTRQGIKSFVDDVLDLFPYMSKKLNFKKLGYYALSNINNSINNINSGYTSYLHLNIEQITTENHSLLGQLDTFLTLLRSLGIYSEIKIDPKEDFTKISEALKFGNELLLNKVAFEKTSEMFNEILGDKDRFAEKLLVEKSALFENTANQYKTFRVEKYELFKTKYKYLNNYHHFFGGFWQMFLAIFFGSIIMYIVYSFIQAISKPENISVGIAILRVSALVVPSYFAFFFSRQFQLSKKMYQFYKFKSVALSTMSNLYPFYPNQQEKIIEKALNVIFSEFTEKDSGEISQKDVMSFLTEGVKAKFN